MDENTADTPLVSLEGQDALITRVLKGVGLVIFMVVMIGTGFGIPALGPIMVEAGVFNNTCVATNSTSDQFLGTDGNNTINVTECVLSQEKHIARATSITLCMMETLCIFVGIVLDLAGTRISLLASSIFWTISVSIMGIYPQNGIAFYLGFSIATFVALPIYFAAIGELVFEISPARFVIFSIMGFLRRSFFIFFSSRYPALMGGILTGTWDLGTITFMLIALIRENIYPDVPFWQIWLGYALVAGVPAILFFSVFWPAPCTKEERAKYQTPSILKQFQDLKIFCSYKIFWVLTLNLSLIITYGAFFSRWFPHT
eukprot:TRINITY_DN1058_c0_g1_i3.p1 TRINITY_DN1058_c0_g1~~TRINITY_DN1058_c0_g1_i3.p1  ORF type:complete len:315 (+),score=36.59 TRINITY_DN1058_c0_g1_i3:74-1018(+)